MILPSGRLNVALAVSALAITWSPLAGASGCLFLIALWWIDGWAAGRSANLELRPSLPKRMGQGQSDDVLVQLENRGTRALRVRLTVDIPLGLLPKESFTERTLVLPARARTTLGFPIDAHERGEHEIGELHYRYLAPMGLAWRQEKQPSELSLLVIPGLREAKEKRLLAWRHYMQRRGLRAVRARGDSGAFESMREYVRGDDPRRIDWKATARRSRTIVRQYEAERSQSLILCIDAGRLMAERVGDRQRIDYALSAAVVLADVARIWSDNVGVFVFSDQIQAVLPPGQYPPDRIPTMLAKVQTRPVEPDYPRALVTLSRMASRRSLIVLFSDVIDRSVSEPISSYAAQLATRHLPLFAAIRNPDLQAAALAPAEDLDAVYHRAAANELVIARAKTLESMRRAGIQVVDVEPTASIEGVVNQYIEIKQRGTL